MLIVRKLHEAFRIDSPAIAMPAVEVSLLDQDLNGRVALNVSSHPIVRAYGIEDRHSQPEPAAISTAELFERAAALLEGHEGCNHGNRSPQDVLLIVQAAKTLRSVAEDLV